VFPATEAFADIGRLRPWAHHPDCARYDHHLIRIRGRPLCLGCVSLTVGALGGVALCVAMPRLLAMPAPVVLGTSFLGAMPAFIQPFTRRKAVKALARASVGLASALLWAWILAGSGRAGWRIVGAVGFLAVLRLALLVRQRRLDNPCATCPYGHKPFCLHYLPQFERLRDLHLARNELGEAATIEGLMTVIRRGEVVSRVDD
jgi:hypothetical protein